MTDATAQNNDDWSDDEEVVKGPGLQLHLEAAPSEDVGPDGGQRMVTVSICVPESQTGGTELPRTAAGRVARAPTDVCCVVDISGSMRQEATYEDENENVKSDGLTYLDIVKHAVKTVAHMLNDDDRLALVAFDDEATVSFALDYMTADGRARALTALEALQPRGRTNIEKGLRTSLDALRMCEETAGWRAKTVLLLTDGVPNEMPEKGHIPVLREYKECHPDFSFMINTFGFGYKLDSQLLHDLAVEGQGTYGFIPDALIVGTSFVDSIANVLSTQTQKATVHLAAKAGARFAGPVLGFGEQMVTETSWGRVVNLGPLQFGGTRQVVVPMIIPAGEDPYLEVVVVYPVALGVEGKASVLTSSRTATPLAVAGLARSDTVSVGYEAARQAGIHLQGLAKQDMAALAQRLASQAPKGSEWITTLQGDVEGRASKALLGNDRFHRWGKHYLLAFMRAHQVQYCTNFMDKSLQGYGGALFRALREEGDRIFVSLPPPKPCTEEMPVAPARQQAYPAAAVPTPARAAVRSASPDMCVYYGGSGGG